MEEVANGVVHPTTKEKLTKYEQLIAEPELRAVWMKTMCIELGRLAQGYEDTKGTNTIKFMTLEEIKQIPGDRTVTYARMLTHLLKFQTDKDTTIRRQQQVHQQLLTKVPIAKPGDVSFVEYNVPTSKGARPPIISQEEE